MVSAVSGAAGGASAAAMARWITSAGRVESAGRSSVSLLATAGRAA
jgi:hypothetical protein